MPHRARGWSRAGWQRGRPRRRALARARHPRSPAGSHAKRKRPRERRPARRGSEATRGRRSWARRTRRPTTSRGFRAQMIHRGGGTPGSHRLAPMLGLRSLRSCSLAFLRSRALNAETLLYVCRVPKNRTFRDLRTVFLSGPVYTERNFRKPTSYLRIASIPVAAIRHRKYRIRAPQRPAQLPDLPAVFRRTARRPWVRRPARPPPWEADIPPAGPFG